MREYVQMASFTHFSSTSVKRCGSCFHSHFIGNKIETDLQGHVKSRFGATSS